MKKDPLKSEIDVKQIVDSIQNDVYLEDFEGFEKRLRQIRERHDFYQLPDFAKEFQMLGIWPIRPIVTITLKIFRKLYFLHSKTQREAFYQLMEEIETLYVALRSAWKNIESREKDNYDQEP